ncbi:hypothetical protein RUM44_010404 [Polyplax serrata]|uniref:Protein sleepless n=1 Tax=Polyplax serrata TaxID=468196 RepID=A0ABR1AVF5_POLSC
MISTSRSVICCIVLLSIANCGDAVRCYQCSSAQDGDDSCGAYSSFEKDKHIPVECNSYESHTPGSFCMKVVQQGPVGFVWDGRWRQVIRRCASVAETGVSGVCNWGVYENGVYWEECYCAEDGCNSSHNVKSDFYTIGLCLLAALFTSTFYFIR